MPSPAAFDFDRLPPSVDRLLVMGAVGKFHLLALAETALTEVAGKDQETAAFLAGLGFGFLAAAWEADPLDGAAAGQLLELDQRLRMLAPQVKPLLARLRDAVRQPEDSRYYARLLERKDHPKTMAFLERQAADEPGNLYWPQQALGLAFYENDQEQAARWLALLAAEEGLLPVAERLRGDAALMREDPEAADGHFSAAMASLPMPLTAQRLAEAARRRGDSEAAIRHLRDALAERPWQTNTVLALHDLLHQGPPQALPGSLAILLYTYNKAAELDATLKNLAETDLGDAVVRVLDNGSTDATSQVLTRAKEWLGERLETIALPVNAGAPAARNWLMRLPEVQARDFVAYLDDDAIVPADWLGRLGRAVADYPRAGVWGCRVVDHANPAMLQSVDLFLTPPREESLAKETRRFSISDLQHQDMDFGQFSYTRPCASVTGCCHLFRTRTLMDCGDFDLRFSPSQYDDLDHDLRLLAMGLAPVYCGGLRVLHMKRTGKAAHTDRAQYGNSMANMYKLQMKHDDQAVAGMMAASLAAAREDLLRKAAALAEEG